MVFFHISSFKQWHTHTDGLFLLVDDFPADTHSQSESRLYSFSQETKDQLRKFRLGTSRAKTPLAKICKCFVSLADRWTRGSVRVRRGLPMQNVSRSTRASAIHQQGDTIRREAASNTQA
jgi:hypothetical protein